VRALLVTPVSIGGKLCARLNG